jgi:N-acylneuraminate cytidylyltransferase
MSVLALIPARGGSKAVPRKNVQLLQGKPLIAYTIDVAKAAKNIDRIIVTTDDEEIRSIAIAAGAEAPFLRPAEIAGDYALDIEYHLHALSWLLQHENYQPTLIANLRPTMPGRSSKVIDAAINYFRTQGASYDALRSVRVAEQSPYKMWQIENNALMPVCTLENQPEPYNMPRQLLPLVYWQDGYIDIAKPATILVKKSTTGDKILPFIINDNTIDIDYIEDLQACAVELKKMERVPS